MLVSFINLIDSSLDLNTYINVEFGKLLFLPLTLKLYSILIDAKMMGLWEHAKKVKNPNNFFQMMLEITSFDAQKQVSTLTEMIQPGLFANLGIEVKELEENELSFRNKESMYDFIYKSSIRKFRKANVKQRNDFTMILDTVKYMIYTCNDPKLCFGYILQCLQRDKELGSRLVFWLLLFRRTSQVILDKILFANTNTLGKMNF